MSGLRGGARKRTLTRRGGLAAAGVLLALGGGALAGGVAAAPARAATTGARAATRAELPSPVPAWTQYDTDDGPDTSTAAVPVRVWLASRAPAAETRFAAGASTPGNAGYGRYLTPVQFSRRFGPAPAETTAVEAWARSNGLTVVSKTAHYVSLTGSAPKLSAALDTSVHAYSNSADGLAGYAPASGMSVPAALGADVATVTGLDSYSYASSSAARASGTAKTAATATAAPAAAKSTAATAAAPASSVCSQWWGQHVSAIPAADGRSSAPDAVCGYTPQQLRSAYGVSAASGKGATIAIVLDGSLSSMAADANRFFGQHHLPGFAPGQFTVNTGPGYAASCAQSADLPEEPLDVETAHIVAPAAKVVYVAANCSFDNAQEQQQDFLDAETRVVDQHLADVSTESYSVVESFDFTPASAAAWTAVFEQGAAEGIGFNFDSGDGGDNSGSGVDFPASDPWATAVGGTTLEIGARGTVAGELGWGDDGADENAAGSGYQQAPPGTFVTGSTGGRSALFAEPGYQRGVVPAALATDGGTLPAGREVPDIAADADPMTGWEIGFTTPGSGYGVPLLYRLRGTAGIRDITEPSAPALTLAPDCYNDQVTPDPACLVTLGQDSSLTATPGYDDVTGVGAATSHFVAALASPKSRHRSGGLS